MEADYVVIGAGAAGSVLAARLAEDPAVVVALLEAGGRNRHPLLRVPKGFYRTMTRPAHAAFYATGDAATGDAATGDAATGGEGEWWLRGRGLGGSTAINGMMYVRGAPADWNAIAAAADDPLWSWEPTLAAYRAMEDHALGASPLRGTGGPLAVSIPRSDDLVVAALHDAAVRLGLVAVDDVNAGDVDRIGPAPSTIRHGLRVSAATAFLNVGGNVGRRQRRPNLDILDRTLATHVVIEGGRAMGVAAVRDGRPMTVTARREVILAAGSLESPGLLERSGIGNPSVLTRAGIAVGVESPNVGERLLEHRALTVHARLRPGLGLNERFGTLPRQVLACAGYLATRRGPIATGPYDLIGQLRTSAAAPRPDVQVLLTPMSTDRAVADLRPAPYAGLMVTGYALRPTTAGSVHVRSADPAVLPCVNARYLETDADRATTAAILPWIRRLLATAPVADLVVAEVAPGADVVTPDQAVAYALATGGGVYHAVGTCALGSRDEDVVDARLRVRGVRGLRVCDASVFPVMPAGNTAAPTMVLGWRAAQLVLEEAQP